MHTSWTNTSLNDAAELRCPCGSGRSYRHCCHPVHLDHSNAKTAESLMRARYSANALGRSDFLLSTWARESRPARLDLSPSCKWMRLTIVKSSNYSEKKSSVSFEAYMADSGKVYLLKEKSRFVLRSGRWYYEDGDTELSELNIGNNEKCPCGSGKKFKRCCR